MTDLVDKQAFSVPGVTVNHKILCQIYAHKIQYKYKKSVIDSLLQQIALYIK